MGIFFFFAAIADKQLFVSPRINIASGFKSSNTLSILIKIFPIVFDGELSAASRNISGFDIFKSLKKLHLNYSRNFDLYDLKCAELILSYLAY